MQGGFPPEVFDELSRNNGLAREIVQDLLDAHFPETIHRDILDAVGIEFSMETRVVIARDRNFESGYSEPTSTAARCAVSMFGSETF